MTDRKRLNLLIASFISEELVDRIARVDERLNVVYRRDLLRPARWSCDHDGAERVRSPEQESEWKRLLAEADILFDFDQTHREDLPDLAPNVKWIQATASGIGEFVAEMRYVERMPHTVFTNTAGIHGKPLAEFSVMAMLLFRKKILDVLRHQAKRTWVPYAGTDLDGRTVVIVGFGGIGREVGRLCRALGMHVVGVGRSESPDDEALAVADEYVPVADLTRVLPQAEHLVLVVPHTPDTIRLIGEDELRLLPSGAVLINIGRGSVVDEVALIAALESGHLSGAGLDVFEQEPLPRESPLWSMENVLVCPHSGAHTDRENDRIVDLFCENLRRFMDGVPLLNTYDPERRY